MTKGWRATQWTLDPHAGGVRADGAHKALALSTVGSGGVFVASLHFAANPRKI